MTSRIEQLLPLPPVTLHILLTLAEGECHGYGIKKEIARRTDGKLRLGPGSLYGAIKTMLDKGLIEESDERPDFRFDDERRRYYRLTRFGRQVAQAELERMRRLVRQGDELLETS